MYSDSPSTKKRKEKKETIKGLIDFEGNVCNVWLYRTDLFKVLNESQSKKKIIYMTKDGHQKTLSLDPHNWLGPVPLSLCVVKCYAV